MPVGLEANVRVPETQSRESERLSVLRTLHLFYRSSILEERDQSITESRAHACHGK